MSDTNIILAVDDTTESLALLGRILTSAGYEVRLADSGELALDAIATQLPDLILTDIRMPGMDGLQVCERLKSADRTRHIPVILMSAFAEVKDWVQGLKLGAVDYISKPFQAEELLSRVRTHLALGRTEGLKQEAVALRLANAELEAEIIKRREAEGRLRQSLVAVERSRRAELDATQEYNRAEYLRRQSDERYRSLVENSQEAIYVVQDAAFCFVNRKCLEMTGLKEAELLGRSILDFVPEADRDRVLDHHRRICRGEGSDRGEEFRLKLASGEERWLLVNAVQIQWEGRSATLNFASDVTERKQADSEREALARQRKLALNAAKLGWWHYDPQTRMATWDERYKEIFGVSENGRPNEEILARLHPDDLPKVWAAVEAALDPVNPQPYAAEYRVRHPDGSVRWVQAHGLAEFAGEGQARYAASFVGTVADVTERKLAELDLQRQAGLINSLLDSIPDLIFHKDLKGVYLGCNPAFAEFVGRPREQIIGRTDADIFTKDVADAFRENDRMMLESLTSRQNEEWVDYPDGRRVLLDTLKTPYWDPNGGLVGVLGISRDITDRKRAEAQLLASKATMQAALASMTDAVSISDAEGRFVDFNDAFATFHKFKNKQECAKTLAEYPVFLEVFMANGEPAPLEQWAVSRALRGEIATNAEYTLRRKDTGESWVGSYSFAPIRDKNGVIVGSVVTGRDVTEHRQLEAQFRQAQKLEAVGQLAGGIAHDFNNMLSVIIGHSEMLTDRLDPASPLRSSLAEITNAARRSADLTRQLLAFARKQTVAPRVLDLNEAIKGMLKILQRLIGEDIDLLWRPDECVWPVLIDPSQIDQILANLCVNARDAIADVGKVTIETGNDVFDSAYCAVHAGMLPGEYVRLAVSDNGCGMDKQTQARVFEPFFTTKETGKGTGLGLATVYGIVRQNNGFINVYSEPGHGTTFKIYLPHHAGNVDVATMDGMQRQLCGGHETILLVEDEPAILTMTSMMLEQQGYTVLVAATPRDALRLASEHAGEIHLLLTDVVMPEMNGRDLAGKILAIHPSIKRLFMSAYTANVIAHHGVLDQGVQFISKPFSIDDLAAKVRESLDAPQA